MFPIGDDNSERRTFPFVNIGLIVLNVVFFFVEMSGGEPFILQWAFVPSRFLAAPAAEAPTVFSAMFMHAGWMHLGGNMLYLWIFGDNVEDRFGHFGYLVFYLLCGLGATGAQLALSVRSNVPNLGASGAIAGVLGAYILLFPQGRVRTITQFGRVVEVPALLMIGFWFVLQLFSELGSLASTEQAGGGVAYMAHIGGFGTGLLLSFLFRGAPRPAPGRPWS